MTINENIAKTDLMNKAVSDDELSAVSGGYAGSGSTPRFSVGSTVNYRNCESLLGEGTVSSADHEPLTGMWYYMVFFPKVNETSGPIPERDLY